MEDGFLTRNYGAADGELYKPDSMEIGGSMGERGDTAFDDFSPFGENENNDRPEAPEFSADSENGVMTPPDGESSENGGFSGKGGFLENGDSMGGFAPGKNTTDGDATDTNVFPDGGFPQNGGFNGEIPNFDAFNKGGGFSMSGNGADQHYTDDDPDSYSAIWDGEVTSTTEKDHTRVVTALEKIAAGEELSTYMDTDNLVRYMAAHIFSVNEDSLSGSMAHNYYLYEANGRLNLIPWDYNLAFGGMSGGDATSMVNDPIDDPFDATDFFDTLLADPTYYAAYRENLEKLVEYVENGAFDAFYSRVRTQIDTLVEMDPTAFYTYDEYVTAAETFYTVVKLRAQSIAGQLDGTIPSTAEEQRRDDSSLIDASDVNLTAMGVMNGGGRGGENMPARQNDNSGDDANLSDGSDGGTMPPEKPEGSSDGITPPDMSGTTEDSGAVNGDGSAGGSGNIEGFPNGNGKTGNLPQRPDFANGTGTLVTMQSGAGQNLVWLIGCVLICSSAILFVLLYKKHPRHG